MVYIDGSCDAFGTGCAWIGTFHSTACGCDMNFRIECSGPGVTHFVPTLSRASDGAVLWNNQGSNGGTCSPLDIIFNAGGHIHILANGCGTCSVDDPFPGWIFNVTSHP
jgi:hypothetical protein